MTVNIMEHFVTNTNQNNILSSNFRKTAPFLKPENVICKGSSNCQCNTCYLKNIHIPDNFSYWNPFNWLDLWNENAIEDCEQKIYHNIKIPIKRFYVYCNRSHLTKIWTLTANPNSKNLPIVLIHGFCCGSAIWANNIEQLSENRPVIAFDLLGFGRSSRPSFSSDPKVAETQFIESIEDWRKRMGLEEFILLGHGFGAFIAAAFALKHPKLIKGLILADAWGFQETKNEPRPETPIPGWLSILTQFSRIFSTMFIYRIPGCLGINLLKKLRPDIGRRYNLLDDSNLIYKYLYHANNLKPTGEEGFRSMSKYHGYARDPMINRIDKIKPNIPIWFIYGSRTWIDYTTAYSCIWLRNRVHSKASHISVELIEGAGHYLYSDKPKEFNEYVGLILKEIEINCVENMPNSEDKFWFCSDIADVNDGYLKCKFHEQYNK